MSPAQQLRQPHHIGRNPPRLIFAEQLGCRASPRLILEIDIGELLTVVIADNETGNLAYRACSFLWLFCEWAFLRLWHH